MPAAGAFGRVSLAQSASDPARIYALLGKDDFVGLYRTRDAAGASWELCTDSSEIKLYGSFTNDVEVDPTTPDTVYVSGVELYKCRRNQSTGAWTVANIGGSIHPDSHCFAFHPARSETIYSGNDGGFYVSRNGGASWDDTPNEGLCLLQYEAIDDHGQADGFLQCGTQDNGTQQYRNSPVHYHSADGDGGYCLVSKTNGNQVVHSYYGKSLEWSDRAGEFGSYVNVSGGLDGGGLFYPPAAISPVSGRVAVGTTRVNIDDAMGLGGWPGSGVALAGLSGPVSAVSFAGDDRIYCATTSGQVYRLDRRAASWNVRPLHAPPLPAGAWIWDVQSLPGDADTIMVAFSGFGLARHVWRGAVPASGPATWSAASNGLPDVPMYALALASPTAWYVGTDIGVFRTIDAGAHWTNYSQGLPNTAIYDLRLNARGKLLRAATHGRGLWELRSDVARAPTVDIFVRNNIMDTAREPGETVHPRRLEGPHAAHRAERSVRLVAVRGYQDRCVAGMAARGRRRELPGVRDASRRREPQEGSRRARLRADPQPRSAAGRQRDGQAHDGRGVGGLSKLARGFLERLARQRRQCRLEAGWRGADDCHARAPAAGGSPVGLVAAGGRGHGLLPAGRHRQPKRSDSGAGPVGLRRDAAGDDGETRRTEAVSHRGGCGVAAGFGGGRTATS